MGLTEDALQRLQVAVTSEQRGNELAGVIGITGGFRTDASTGATIVSQSGSQDGLGFNCVPDPSGTAGAYKIYIKCSTPISAILDIKVSGFVPKNPGAAGDAYIADVSGYNVAEQYVTVRTVALSNQAVTPVPNWVMGFRIAVALKPQY
jgi:hypothetical protein